MTEVLVYNKELALLSAVNIDNIPNPKAISVINMKFELITFFIFSLIIFIPIHLSFSTLSHYLALLFLSFLKLTEMQKYKH